MMLRADDIIGKVYNDLTVLNLYDVVTVEGSSRKRKYTRVLCQCICGKEHSVEYHKLIGGYVKSCGCLLTRLNKGRHKEFGEAASHNLYLDYAKGARKRNYCFELTELEFLDITKRTCFWCGCNPNQKIGGRRTYGYYVYNGLDRLDNTIGYTLENCVPCCFNCNRAKSTMSSSAFIEWGMRLGEHLCSINTEK